MSTPVAGPLVVTPVFATPGDVLVEWDDVGDTWRSVDGYLTAATADARYVNVAGDVMTGNLDLPGILLSGNIFATSDATHHIIYDKTGNGALILGGTGDPQNYYRNTTHAFQAAAGAATYMTLNTLGMGVSGQLNVNGPALLGDAPGAGDARVEIGSNRTADGNAYIDLHASVGSDNDGRWFRAAGVNGGMTINNAGTGAFYLGADNAVNLGNYTGGVVYAYFNSNQNLLLNTKIYKAGAGDPLLLTVDSGLYCRVFYQGTRNWSAGASAAGTFIIADETGGAIRSEIDTAGTWNQAGYVKSAGWGARAGTPGPSRANVFNIDWSPANLWIDNVNLGSITTSCDYRIKDNVAELPSTWDAVKALRPITYNYKACPELLREADDPAPRWGFLAHELQATLLPTAASGEKDAPNEVQSPDLVAMLAAVTRALQETMARVEALEARAG